MSASARNFLDFLSKQQKAAVSSKNHEIIAKAARSYVINCLKAQNLSAFNEVVDKIPELFSSLRFRRESIAAKKEGYLQLLLLCKKYPNPNIT